MDVVRLARQLGIDSSSVIARAKEFVSLASVKTSGLGQGEVCKASVCLELACREAQCNKDLTRDLFVKHGCVNAKVYTNTFNLLQRVLGATRKVDLQHLVMQFGCTSCRQSITRVMQLYKDRFLAKLSESEKANADFGRPVFLAVAFYLVARKNKIKVDQRDLLETMCVPRDDFLNVSASVYELCFDVVGVKKTKTKAAARKTNTNVMDNHRPELSDTDEEGESGAEGRKSKRARKQQADYDEWKLLALQQAVKSNTMGGEGSDGQKKTVKLKQSKLAF